jgi:hypothetical protein
LAAVPAEGSSLSSLGFSVSTVSLFKYVLEHRVLLRIGEKFADPDDLLEPFIFANLKNDLLSARELVRREPITSVDHEPDIAVISNQRRGWNLVYWTPRKPKRSRVVECVGRKAEKASSYNA